MSHSLVSVQDTIAERPAPQAVLEAFLNTLDSPRTIRAYRREVMLALAEWPDLAVVTAGMLTEHRKQWVDRLDDKRDDCLSPSAVLRHLAAVRSFLKFARLTGQIRLQNDVIQFALKSPSAEVIKPYQILNRAERDRIIRASQGNMRDRVMLEFALNTGLRASEVCALRVSSLIEDDQIGLLAHVRQGKGRKDRLVPVKDDTALIVRVYLKARKLQLGGTADGEEYLFPSRKGSGHGRIHPGHLWKIVVKYARAAGITKVISPHSLRHTAAMTWLKHGASVPDVQKLLGHASMATTQKYLDHLDLERLKDVVNAK